MPSRIGAYVAAVIAMAFVAGCEQEPEGGPGMSPGEPCLSCHSSSASGEGSEHPFTAAGTVFDHAGGAGAEGVTVTLTDSAGATVTLVTNRAGNFYTSTPLVAPLDVTLSSGARSASMPSPAASGDCNACHFSGLFSP